MVFLMFITRKRDRYLIASKKKKSNPPYSGIYARKNLLESPWLDSERKDLFIVGTCCSAPKAA